MREIFHDMPTVIYMWDNILVLGEDQENLVDNLIPFFERCRKYNLKLKMAKSTFGFEQVSFFGYERPTVHVHDLIMQGIRSGRYAPFGVTHGQGPLEWCSLAEMDYTTLKSILVVYSRLNPLLGDMVVIYPLDSTLLCALR